jgi:hypothetical protein
VIGQAALVTATGFLFWDATSSIALMISLVAV